VYDRLDNVIITMAKRQKSIAARATHLPHDQLDIRKFGLWLSCKSKTKTLCVVLTPST
jgi:hypothetical protein